jgi:nucleotide-binding universal stress UspA family protein
MDAAEAAMNANLGDPSAPDPIPPPVVAGIDGSPRSLDVVEMAAVEAAHRRRPLKIVHAVDAPAELADQYLAEAALLAEKVAPEVPRICELLTGPPAPALLAESGRAALLAVGDRGLGGFPGLIVGSVAVHAATHAACPVLIVRGQYVHSGPIVAGFDGSPGSVRALEFAVEEASLRAAEVVVLQAAADNGAPAAGTADETVAQVTARHPGVTMRREQVHDAAGRALTRWSRAAQLLVVGDRGHGGFAGLQLGSVSQHLVYHAGCPTVVVRAQS